MKVGDQVRFFDQGEAAEADFEKDAVGVVLRLYDLPGNPRRIDVQFPGRGLLEGLSEGRFVPADPAS